ncbi:poly-gamma-glutamate hydrolase family protein [Streptomyces sp. NPDC052077]|uniref:poly-gamma-glutamate hydrolase family protein n=1 Tax=Streptomyces sp. NPDC052077 TaxID=3154757 RepID=UPI003438AFDE
MADLYPNYAALAAAETYGVDYQIVSTSPPGATWASIAIHGGGIEAGTSEVAEAVATTGGMRFYEFDGMKTSGNGDLHLTSTAFDEPQGLALVASSARTVSFHGYVGSTGVPETAIGGLDTALVARLTTALRSRGFLVSTAPSEIAGTNPANICNKNSRSGGVQLEMSRALRESMFTDFTRTGRKTKPRTPAFYDYVAAVLATVEGRGLVSLGSVNVSRWTTIPAPGPDTDLTASVATSALAVGGGHFLALASRWTDVNNAYLARLEFSASQAVILTLRKRVGGTETFLVQRTLGATHAAGRRFRLRFQTTGTTLRARAWQDGTPEPGGWHVETTDTDLTAAGAIGTRSILSSANTNTLPVVASWGDVTETSHPQRLTVTRAINAITKPHTTGTDVRVATPVHAAL